jgi:hypothetical protein
MFMQHKTPDIIYLFNVTFSRVYNTRLIKGEGEPIYIPKSKSCSYHQIVFAHGYFSSALHEISHWCQAGAKRRLLEDYGYWYSPDGRNGEQQIAFEQVEVIPQAIEWAFHVASGKKFNVSIDNLSGIETDSSPFKTKVYDQVLSYLSTGFPKRASEFIRALADFYHVDFPLSRDQFVQNNPSTVEHLHVKI